MTNVHMAAEAEAPVSGTGTRPPQHFDPILAGLLAMCRLYDRSASAAELTAGLPLKDGKLTPALLRRAAARAALDVRVAQRAIDAIDEDLLPALVIQDDGSTVILVRREDDDCIVLLPDHETREVRKPLETLKARHSGMVAFAAPLERKDGRAGAFAAEPKGHWFWSEVVRLWPVFLEVMFASALANVLAVVTSLFAMQVYDRVVPNLAFATLWVLAAGVGLAIIIEAMVRMVRAHLMEVAGKQLDLKLSSRIFERALGMRLQARPKSTGAFANQVREFDAVREFFTSTTIGALSDIPFVFVFIGIIAMIGGPVAFVLIGAVPLIVVPGLLAQWPMSRLSRRNLREGAVRNGLLMEALSGVETVKASAAEGRFQRLWEEYSGLLARNGIGMRVISGALTYSAAAVQQASYVLVMVVGVYQIAAGQMTVGALLACAILSSRTIAPLTQMAGIFGRLQHMRSALAGIDTLMAAPVDRPADREFVHRPNLVGHYVFENVAFAYDADSNPALQVPSLTLQAGTGTALMGGNGSGKSTLLKLMAGLYEPSQGQFLLDGTDIRQIDPADLRKAIGYLPQDVRLFFGTLRDNLRLGLEHSTDEELLEALAFVGADRLVQEHPLGLDRMIGEGGAGVSGGQRQSIGMARIWLRDPRIVILDEPTAAMDRALEIEFISKLKQWAAGRTLIVATHRQPVLALASRAMVLNSGRIMVDGPVESVMAVLSGKARPQVASPNTPPVASASEGNK
ncbi:type I secretion system permease/ATPase [Pelagibacterium halotolerans]|uniref:type I secretion system permease/ATPase n=1 Tax=Pelagibacterium halotolerans TaxID=531813 RepID=UPI00384F1EA8